MDKAKLETAATNARITAIKAVHAAGSGHPGGSLSAMDIITMLYFDVMNIDPKNPKDPDRDRFVLSKGHAAPALYSVLAERGYYPKEDVLTLRKLGSHFQGHPNMNYVPGVDMSTGSLGQGLSVSVGMALAAKLDHRDYRVYTLMGDGEVQEGMVWEAAMSAAHYHLNNITAFLDWNGLQIDGNNDDVMSISPIDKKFEGFGWNVLTADGHDFDDLKDKIEKAHACTDKPSIIICKTIKGKGVSYMEDEAGWHGKAPNDEEYAQAMKELGGEI